MIPVGPADPPVRLFACGVYRIVVYQEFGHPTLCLPDVRCHAPYPVPVTRPTAPGSWGGTGSMISDDQTKP